MFRLLGWSVFRYGDVWIYQRGALVNQLEIVNALDATDTKRSYCDDDRFEIFVEDDRFEGVNGATARAELVRFKGRNPRALLRVSPSGVEFAFLVDLIGGLARVD